MAQNIALAEQKIDDVRRSGARELFLNYLSLKQLPASLFSLHQLTTLVLAGNELTAIPEEIGQLHNLEILDLAGNHLIFLPKSLGQLKRLQQLDFASNEVKSLPESIQNLGCLKYLDGVANKISYLPEGITQCEELSTLRLGENELVSIPERIGHFSKLEILDLSNNQLESLPNSFVQLVKLKELQLNGNLLDVPYYHLSKLSHQPTDLIKIIFDINEEKRLRAEESMAEKCRIEAREYRVNQWICEQRRIIEQLNWGTQVKLKVPMPSNPPLLGLSKDLAKVSHVFSILDYVYATRNELPNMWFVELINSLECAAKGGDRDELLARLVATIPNEGNQPCTYLKFDSTSLNETEVFEISVTTSKAMHRFIALFVSFHVLQFKEWHNGKQALVDIEVLTRQLKDIVEARLNNHEKLAKSIISLGQIIEIPLII